MSALSLAATSGHNPLIMQKNPQAPQLRAEGPRCQRTSYKGGVVTEIQWFDKLADAFGEADTQGKLRLTYIWAPG